MALTFKKASPGTKEKRAPKRRVIKAAKGAKFVLFVGDEGAILIYIKGKTVQSRQFVHDTSPQNLMELKESLSRDTRAPIMLIVDTIDQSYLQQTLPPVSSLGVNKLIKRRLERDYAPEEIKGALLLGREKSGRKDWNFLMIAIESSAQLKAWFNFVGELPNKFLGIYLVAVEAENIVKGLDRVIGAPKGGTGSEWKFFVSHNKVGGFRQVVLRNGRIVFTRMAQPVADSNTEVIAGNIEQEIINTIEYMKRLSFSASAGLDIYIIASSGIKSLIEKDRFNARNLHIFTPFEVAERLGIEGACQPSDQFGDVILAATIGSSRSRILRLAIPQLAPLDRYYQLITYQRAAAACAMLGILGYIGFVGFDIYDFWSQKSDLMAKKGLEQQQISSLRSEIEKTHIDVEGASDLIDLYRQILIEKASPLPFIEQLTPITQSPVWIKSIEWSLEEAQAAGSAIPVPQALTVADKGEAGNPHANDRMTSAIGLEFPEAANNKRVFRVVAKKIIDDFKEMYKGYEIKYTNLPPGYLENDRLEIDFNASGPDLTNDTNNGVMPEATVTIKGLNDMKKAADEAAKQQDTAAVPGAPISTPSGVPSP